MAVPKPSFTQVILQLLGMLAACVATYHVTREPNADLDPQAVSNLVCRVDKVLSEPNGSGMVVTVQNVSCGFVASTLVTYVYLGEVGRRMTRVNHVLRYEGEDPKVTWVKANSLLLTVPVAWDVDKQVSELLGVHVRVVFEKMVPSGTPIPGGILPQRE